MYATLQTLLARHTSTLEFEEGCVFYLSLESPLPERKIEPDGITFDDGTLCKPKLLFLGYADAEKNKQMMLPRSGNAAGTARLYK
jgi:hypothetical protein